MTNPMIEAAAKAIALAEYYGHEIFLPLALHSKTAQARYLPRAQAAITAIEPMIRADERAQVEREIVEWLRGHSDPGIGYWADYLAECIDAGEHRK